jgi:magnesium transporter
VVATAVVAFFERALVQNVAIAFFVPGLVYLAGAIGTQTEMVAVRGLSLSHSKLPHLIGGELRTGLMIGMVLGSITFPAVWLVFGDIRLAAAVAGSVFFAGGMATTIGLFLPWLLQQAGSDPAYGSGPLATIIQDVLSLLIYFAVISVVVL